MTGPSPLLETLDAGARALLLYDLDCGFCRWCVGTMLALDRAGRVRPAPIQSAEGERALAGLDPSDRLASWHLTDGSGTVYSGGAVFPPLLRLLPRGRRFAALTALHPPTTERLYRFGADRRSNISRLVPEAAKRWADAQIERRRAATATTPGPAS